MVVGGECTLFENNVFEWEGVVDRTWKARWSFHRSWRGNWYLSNRTGDILSGSVRNGPNIRAGRSNKITHSVNRAYTS